MLVKQMVELIALGEGKKQGVNIAQIKEIVKVFALICRKNPSALACFITYGHKLECDEKIELLKKAISDKEKQEALK